MPRQRCAFLYLPLVVLAVFSFNESKFTIWEGLSLNWYRAVLSNADLAWAAAQQRDHRDCVGHSFDCHRHAVVVRIVETPFDDC